MDCSSFFSKEKKEKFVKAVLGRARGCSSSPKPPGNQAMQGKAKQWRVGWMVVGELQSTPGGPGQKYTKLSVESHSLL